LQIGLVFRRINNEKIEKMGYVKCSKCKKDYFINHNDPQLHYAPMDENEVLMCRSCFQYENAADGTWLQDERGNYFQKGKPKN